GLCRVKKWEAQSETAEAGTAVGGVGARLHGVGRKKAPEKILQQGHRKRGAIDRVPGMSPDVKTALGMQLAVENANSAYM
ncbi:hypothetical protein IHE44_0004788, partial [Lamprotornis superbus]